MLLRCSRLARVGASSNHNFIRSHKNIAVCDTHIKCSHSTSAQDSVEEPMSAETVNASYNLLTKRTNVEINIRTTEDDPTKHDDRHEGLYYRISNKDYTMYFEQSARPEFKKQVNSFQECAVMIRKPALEVFDILECLNYSHPPLRIILYGKNGSGKSVALSHIVHRCAKMDWFIIHVPSMQEMLRYNPWQPPEAVSSWYKAGRFDYTDLAAGFLMYLRSHNMHHLDKFKLTKEYKMSEKEVFDKGSSLLEMVDFGIERKKYASDCIGSVFREVKLQAAENGLKVLVAIDGVNGLWKDIVVKTEKKNMVTAQDVSMFHHFLRLFERTWTNGVIVGTVCPTVEKINTKLDLTTIPYTPQSLLKKQGFEYMDPFIPLLVPEFSNMEANNCIDYYIERKWILRPRGCTPEGKKELIMLSNRNPLELMRISAKL